MSKKIDLDILMISLRLLNVEVNPEILSKVVKVIELMEEKGDKLMIRDVRLLNDKLNN